MKNIPLLLLLLFSGACTKQTEKPFKVSDLRITWSVLENFGGTYANSWRISNTGESIFPDSGWTIYYNHVVGAPVPESISGSLNITQISGSFYSITPSEAFRPLGKGESTRLDLQCEGSGIKITDAPSGLYLVFEGQDPLVIENFEIGPFPPADLLRRSDNDNIPVPTTESRFEKNQSLSLISQSGDPSVIPTPRNITAGDGSFSLPDQLVVSFQQGLEKEAGMLIDKLKTSGRDVIVSNNPAEGHIKLALGGNSVGEPENYRLSVNKENISIEGSDPSGVFYGTQSLLSLWPLEAWENSQDAPLEIKCQTILDGPRFSYRGLYLDVARNFQKPEAVKKIMDIMAFYKMNKFMFGLSNDEGWRIEIRDIPELTAVGSVRGHTGNEKDHLMPAYGSGPFPNSDNNHGSGHYSREEFIDLLKYAHERHIEVIPEINFPGHARAAIKSMAVRASQTGENGSEEPSYRLHDPDDQSEYKSVQGYDDNVICPCQESVYQFLETVIAEVVSMFQEAGAKLTTIHTGGDEVPEGIWENSPLCAEFLQANPQIEGVAGLPGYFLQRFHEILEQHQLVTAGWEEIAMHKVESIGGTQDNPTEARKVMVPNTKYADSNFLPYVWLSIWGVAGEDLAYQLANMGYKVVMCNASNLYFDFAYNKDPMEPGFYWAGLVNTRKPYELVPMDVLQSATVDIMGNPLDMERYENYIRLTEEGRKNIQGIQGQLWSETVKGPKLMEYYLLPKMLGLCERAWAPDPGWAHLSLKSQRLSGLDQAWNQFANTLGQRELARLDYLWGDVNYRIPMPGAVIEDGNLKANVAFPGLTIRYTLDGSEPNERSPLYEGPVEAKKPVRLKAFTRTGKASRTSVLSF